MPEERGGHGRFLVLPGLPVVEEHSELLRVGEELKLYRVVPHVFEGAGDADALHAVAAGPAVEHQLVVDPQPRAVCARYAEEVVAGRVHVEEAGPDDVEAREHVLRNAIPREAARHLLVVDDLVRARVHQRQQRGRERRQLADVLGVLETVVLRVQSGQRRAADADVDRLLRLAQRTRGTHGVVAVHLDVRRAADDAGDRVDRQSLRQCRSDREARQIRAGDARDLGADGGTDETHDACR